MTSSGIRVGVGLQLSGRCNFKVSTELWFIEHIETMMTHRWFFDKESFFDFLGFVIVYAPDFPEEDFLEPNEQLDLERAFEELSNGLKIVWNELTKADAELGTRFLAVALKKFQDGDEVVKFPNASGT